MSGVRAVFMRGGTSKGLFFHAADLPPEGQARDDFFLAALGSPDPYGRQLDGMGGGLSSLSKVAIVSASARAEADVDYTFGQVGIQAATVDYGANCGNLSAAVGPFALEEGLIARADGLAAVRIFNTNTASILVARFEVADGVARERGDLAIAGVAGAGAPIALTFLAPGGSATGAYLPTGRPLETLEVEGVGAMPASLLDAASPMAFVAAADLGVSGHEAPEELEAIPGFLARAEAVRCAAAQRMGLLTAQGGAQMVNPRVALLAHAADYVATDGRRIEGSAYDLSVRMLSLGRVHRAMTLTGAMCLAAACQTAGTLPAQICAPSEDGLLIGHPAGILPAQAEVVSDPAGPRVVAASVYRTARRLMEGRVLTAR
jgi:2-methylaconitate isomerase